jgi:hypothetical protein
MGQFWMQSNRYRVLEKENMNKEGSTLTATIKGTKSSLTIDDEEYF